MTLRGSEEIGHVPDICHLLLLAAQIWIPKGGGATFQERLPIIFLKGVDVPRVRDLPRAQYEPCVNQKI